MIVAALLAHQGGWDEILLVAGPMVIVAALLVIVKRRVTRVGPTPDRPPDPGVASETTERRSSG